MHTHTYSFKNILFYYGFSYAIEYGLVLHSRTFLFIHGLVFFKEILQAHHHQCGTWSLLH